jgi:hypothetical protein
MKKATQVTPEWLFVQRHVGTVFSGSAIQTAEPTSHQAFTADKAALKVALGRMMVANLAWSGM